MAEPADFNPAYPRIAARPHGTLQNSSAVDSDSRHIALHQVAILAADRIWKMGGYDMATLPAHIKSYNPEIKLLKYMNFNQIELGGASLDHNDDWIRVKLNSERGGGGRGDWWKRTTTAKQILGNESGKYQINITLQTTPDKSGLQWPQWFVRYWNAAPGDSGSWVAEGRGLREEHGTAFTWTPSTFRRCSSRLPTSTTTTMGSMTPVSGVRRVLWRKGSHRVGTRVPRLP